MKLKFWPENHFSTGITWAISSLLLLATQLSAHEDDWSRWRGPTGNGVAAANQKPPVSWDQDSNIIWKTKIPGRGHSSPIVVGNRIFLTTADEQAETQSVLCFERKSGKKLWQTLVNRGNFNPKIHEKNTHASPTVAILEERVFAVFNNNQRIQLVSLDFSGTKLWEKNVGQFQSKYPFGFAASPIVHQSNVVVTNQNEGNPAMVAFDGESGKEQWRAPLPKRTSYSTPVVATVANKTQLLLSGVKSVAAFNPDNGNPLWTCPAKWDVTCGTMVWDQDTVYASGGYPPQQTLAVKADGSGKMVWENSTKCYEQSMIVVGDYLYGHGENGVLYCWRTRDGKEMWSERFSSRKRPQSASPVLANGNLYFTAENGETRVIQANPKKFQSVSRNQLGNEAFASLAICGNQIFARIAEFDAVYRQRQEWLVCLGDNP